MKISCSKNINPLFWIYVISFLLFAVSSALGQVSFDATRFVAKGEANLVVLFRMENPTEEVLTFTINNGSVFPTMRFVEQGNHSTNLPNQAQNDEDFSPSQTGRHEIRLVYSPGSGSVVITIRHSSGHDVSPGTPEIASIVLSGLATDKFLDGEISDGTNSFISVHPETRDPLDIVFCLDGSASMQESGKWDQLLEATDLMFKVYRRFATSLETNEDDRWGYVLFSCGGNPCPTSSFLFPNSASFANILDGDSDELKDDLTAITPEPGTPIWEGLSYTKSNLFNPIPGDRQSKRMVLLITDGKNNSGREMSGIKSDFNSNPESTDFITTHVIGLGRDEEIDPQDIRNWAVDFDGNYRITDDLLALKAFCLEVFGSAVGLERIPVDNANKTVELGPGAEKLVLIVNWNAASVGGNFDLEYTPPPAIGGGPYTIQPGITPALPNQGDYRFTYSHPAPGDEHAFWIIEENSQLETITVDANQDVIIGGNFTGVDNTDANRVARRESGNWGSLESNGANDDGVNETVYALATRGGTIYVGGDFTEAGGVIRTRIAKWDTNNKWSSVGSAAGGIDNTVRAIALNSNEDIYIGGDFATAGGSSANRIAKFSNNIWAALESSGNKLIADVPNETVHAIDTFDNKVYVGGTFTFDTDDGSSAHNIAMWLETDATDTWATMGNGVEGTVYAIAAKGSTEVYVGGDFTFTYNGNQIGKNIAKWDGNNWSNMGNPVNGIVKTIAIKNDTDNELYIGGDFTLTTAGGMTANNIAKWDGNCWSNLGSGMNGPVKGIAIGRSSVFACGEFDRAGGNSTNGLAAWDGCQWSSLGEGVAVSASRLAGTWKFEPEAGETHEEMLAFVNPDMQSQFYFTRKTHGTGQEIQLFADLREGMEPLHEDSVEVEVTITRPLEGIGDLLARIPPPGSIPNSIFDSQSPRLNHLKAVYESLKRDSLETKTIVFPLEHDLSSQKFTASFMKTDFEGSYIFNFKASGKTPSGHPFSRSKTIAERVRVEVDSFATVGTIAFKPVNCVEKKLQRTEVLVEPKDKFGRRLGPYRDSQIDFQAENAWPIGNTIDNRNGTYSQIIEYPQGDTPVISITVQDKLIDIRTVEEVPSHVDDPPVVREPGPYCLSLTAGGITFDKVLSLENALLFGLHGRYLINDKLSVIAEALFGQSQQNKRKVFSDFYVLSAGIGWRPLKGLFSPFATALVNYWEFNQLDTTVKNPGASFGLGVMYHMSDRAAFTVEGRDFILRRSDQESGSTHNWSFLASLKIQF